MIIRKLKSKSGFDVILFSENKKEDYLYNHLLFMVGEQDTPKRELSLDKLRVMPDKVVASDKKIYFQEEKYEQNRIL